MCGLDVGGRGVGTRTEVNLEETEEAGEEREGEGRLERYQPRPHQSDRTGGECVEEDLLRSLLGDRHIVAPFACREHTRALLQPDSKKRKAAC